MAVLVVGGLRFDRLLDRGCKVIGLLLLSAVLLTRVVAQALCSVLLQSCLVWRGTGSAIHDLLLVLSPADLVRRDLRLALDLRITHLVRIVPLLLQNLLLLKLF